MLIRTLFAGILLLGLSSPLAAQANDQIEKYYSLVNRAEISITESKFKDALHFYEEASKIKTLFSYDAHNALLCAIETNNVKKAISYAKLLLQKGVPVPYFYQQKFG